MYKKESRKCHEEPNLNKVTDNKEFWKTIKPFLSDQIKTFPKTTLTRDEDIISDSKESKVAKFFSYFFESAVNSFEIKKE